MQRAVFGLAALSLVLLTLTDTAVIGLPPSHPENWVRGVALVLLTGLAFSRSERLHPAAIVFGYALFAVFVAVAYPGA